MDYTVMMPAAGSGTRMGAGQNKLFLKLAGKTILGHTLTVFEEDPWCAGIILAVKDSERPVIEAIIRDSAITKVKALPAGGAERQDSVAACLEAHQEGGIVLVHDAARPFIARPVIHKLAESAAEHGAAVAGVKAKDTMKYVTDGQVEETADRERLWIIQTPQAFRYELLLDASRKARQEQFLGTDEATLAERAGLPVHVVGSTYDNIKMTTPEDLAYGGYLLKKRLEETME
ncbi:2-C-methyl-D-erythritol 4-phosphate cytidylyltransferase [Sporosarcina sp. NCCP-2716]|uniref:2-C-methyl-D-erythritol 4-phosphate cytidylyltransferase n=1 Tax=Sporosarcina sp. NCCP-2716 TaxID=2943679 RepID=UPI00203EF8CB|nr:2-C-methyl-D-erythritol 4-phosphate cytidylyltransferase [Sporosarcina sp. NCCP-2716]GKV68464.1 2-C-methyl-D-erythritol 4-phosphate cytidylyltransferase [Sporosarcina sp. NCCP-2716]